MIPHEGEARPARTGRTSVEAPQRTVTKATSFGYCTPETARSPAARTITRRRYLLTDTLLIVALLAVCTTLYVTAGWMNDHAPQIIAGLIVVACISLLGVIVAAFVAGPKS